jgi:hypothetical protein
MFDDLGEELFVFFSAVFLIQDAVFLAPESDAPEEMLRAMTVVHVLAIGVVP